MEISPIEKGKIYASACIVDNQFIYIIGGSNFGALSDIEKYSIS